MPNIHQARDLIAGGLCSAQCILSTEDQDPTKCTCRCGGRHHGALKDNSDDALVGMYYASSEKCDQCGANFWKYSGYVDARIQPGVYLVSGQSRVNAFRGDFVLVTIEEMAGWNFYLFIEDLQLDQRYGSEGYKTHAPNCPTVSDTSPSW